MSPTTFAAAFVADRGGWGGGLQLGFHGQLADISPSFQHMCFKAGRFARRV